MNAIKTMWKLWKLRREILALLEITAEYRHANNNFLTAKRKRAVRKSSARLRLTLAQHELATQCTFLEGEWRGWE